MPPDRVSIVVGQPLVLSRPYNGSVAIAMTIPIPMPTKDMPTCQSSKPWFVVNTILKAPKKRYRT